MVERLPSNERVKAKLVGPSTDLETLAELGKFAPKEVEALKREETSRHQELSGDPSGSETLRKLGRPT